MLTFFVGVIAVILILSNLDLVLMLFLIALGLAGVLAALALCWWLLVYQPEFVGVVAVLLVIGIVISDISKKKNLL